ncbi:hypothetical protein ACP70R_025825 [Stipagrostis hirtigluma subsp. patula]
MESHRLSSASGGAKDASKSGATPPATPAVEKGKATSAADDYPTFPTPDFAWHWHDDDQMTPEQSVVAMFTRVLQHMERMNNRVESIDEVTHMLYREQMVRTEHRDLNTEIQIGEGTEQSHCAARDGPIGKRVRAPLGRKPRSSSLDDYYYTESLKKAKIVPPAYLISEFYCSEEDKEVINKINSSNQSELMAIINGIALTKKDMEKLTMPVDQGIDCEKWLDSKIVDAYIHHMRGGRPHKTYKSKKKGKLGAHDKEQPSNVKEDEKAKSGDKGGNNDKDKPPQKDNRKRKNQGDTTDAQARTRPPSGRAHKPINNKDFVRCTGDDNPTIQYIDASRPEKTLVHIHDVTLTKERLQHIRRIDEWLNDQEIIAYAYCLQEDKNLTTRDGGKVCVTIPRFQRWFATNGNHLKVTGEADYVPWVLDHVANFTDYDMVLMPMCINDNHWILVAINAKQQTIQILNSLGSTDTQLLRLTLTGLESYLQEAANQIGSKWKDLRVASWPFEQVQCPQQTDTSSCGLFMLMFMRYWTGTRLSNEFTQEDIYNFRSKLPVLLVDSKLNKINGGPKSSQPDGKGCDSDNAIEVE